MAAPVRIGVLGAGSIGIRGALEHLAIGDYADRVTLQAVCDSVPGRAKAAAEKYRVPEYFDDYDEMLARADIDAITIGTPIGLHYDQGVKGIEAGKHLHFNKTMSTTVEEADDLIERAERKGVMLVSSPGQMLRPHLRRIKELIGEGALGQVTWAITGSAFGVYHENEKVRQGDDVLYNTAPVWYWRKPGGGPLYDMTVYGLHSLTGILGPAKRVTAMSGTAIKQRSFRGESFECDCDDNSVFLLDFGNALFAFGYGTAAGSVITAFGTPNIYGTKGSVSGDRLNGEPFDFPNRAKHDALGMNAVLPHYNDRHPTEEAHVFEDIMQLVELVRDGTPTVSTPEHARHVIDIIESAYRAAETGQSQELRTTFTPVF